MPFEHAERDERIEEITRAALVQAETLPQRRFFQRRDRQRREQIELDRAQQCFGSAEAQAQLRFDWATARYGRGRSAALRVLHFPELCSVLPKRSPVSLSRVVAPAEEDVVGITSNTTPYVGGILDSPRGQFSAAVVVGKRPCPECVEFQT